MALVKIEEIDLEVYSELRFTHHIMEKGLYLAVEAVETATQNLDLLLKEKDLGIPHSRKKVNNFFNKLDNKEDIPRILYFDLLTANIDRYRNPGNLIFKKTNTGNYILAIDFGYCFFGPYWSSKEYYYDVSKRDLLLLNKSNWESFITTACLMDNYFLGSVFDLLNPFIDFKENPFANIHSIALNLTSNNIADMLKEVPDSWLVEGNHQRNMYLNFLLNQIKRMPGILNYVASQKLFENNKGGILTWPKEQSILIQ